MMHLMVLITDEMRKEYSTGRICPVCGSEMGEHNDFCSITCYRMKQLEGKIK